MASREFDDQEAGHLYRSINRIEDVELLTLKVHLVVEMVLGRLVAARLQTTTANLPRLKFQHLSKLAFVSMTDPSLDGLEAAVNALDDARNAYAHQPTPRGAEGALRRFISLQGYGDWMDRDLETYRGALDRVVVLLLVAADELQAAAGHWDVVEKYLAARATEVGDRVRDSNSGAP